MVVAEEFDGRESFRCEICDLHYRDRGTAEECEEWCSTHESCNFEIASECLESR